MSYKDKVAENKRVAEKCINLGAYNAGINRAYYAAFLHFKDYLVRSGFDYDGFLRKRGSPDRAFSHGTIQSAVVDCMKSEGKNIVDVYKLAVFGNMYRMRRTADYESKKLLRIDLELILKDLEAILSAVA